MKKHTYSSLFVFLLIFSISCQEKEVNTVAENLPSIQSSSILEQYEPGVKGELVKFTNGQESIEFIKKGGQYSIGDIIFTAKQVEEIKTNLFSKKSGRTGLSNSSELWPNGVVFFAISPDLPNQSRVNDAINHWSTVTGITFVERTTQSDYVEFVPSNGCSSSIGRSGGRQVINLAPGCTTGNTIHELGHALGLFHEQSRADRDDYITVNYQNVISGTEINFRTYNEQMRQGFQFSSLDFGSIMMYASHDLSSNGYPTMTKKDGSTFGSQRNGLSGADTYTIARMYFGVRAKVSTQVVEDYTDGSGNQILTVDNYLEFYSDDSYTTPLNISKQIPVPIKIYNRNNFIDRIFVNPPIGTQSYYLGRTTSSCHYNQYGEVDGECYQEAITIGDGWQ